MQCALYTASFFTTQDAFSPTICFTFPMTPEDITSLLTKVQTSDCSIEDAVNQLENFAAETLTDACIDHQRHL